MPGGKLILSGMNLRAWMLVFAVGAAVALCACVATRPRIAARRLFPEFDALPAQEGLPDPLVMLDGGKVTSEKVWERDRRPELKEMFEHYMYGNIPPCVTPIQAEVRGLYADFLDGQASLKLVTIKTGPEAAAPRIDVMLVVPNHRSGPAPVFLAMDFCGNQALTTDKRVPLAHSWLAKDVHGVVGNAATEESRGFQAADWPLAEIVRRGYALAAFYSGDIDSDRGDASTGIYAWLAAGDPAKNPAASRGTLAAWAWGFQRCVDYLVKDPDLDGARVAAVGHSRNGKTALLAAAFDERISIAFPHQAGCGGTAPSRVKNDSPERNSRTHETLPVINRSFPHWFNAAFKQFNDAPERLPFDQHCLMALCAPRAVLVSAAEEDQWSNPAGQFEMARAADPVYKLLGVPGLGAELPPGLSRLVGGRLGYYIRPGHHSMTAGDWTVFMDFADAQWKAK